MVVVNKLKSISKYQLVGLALILIGLIFTVRYARGLLESYRAMEYARLNNFDTGVPDPDLLRPWMTLRYIAVAYAVPQEFLFSRLDLPMDRRNSEVSLGDLNRQLGLGRAEPEAGRPPEPAVMDKIREAILEYHANPVPTGLREGGVRPWMTIEYISNSTGIPTEYIFEQIGIPMEGHAFVPLERLADDVRYEGGPRALFDRIQRVVDTYEAAE